MPASTCDDDARTEEEELYEDWDLEDDAFLASNRAKRMQELSDQIKDQRAQRAEGYGTYTQLNDDPEVMQTTLRCKYSLVHFFKSDFNRCRIMDEHLSALSQKHLQTRFLKVDVEHAAFLITKLNIKTLPCVVAFVDGIMTDKIIGFQGVGSSQDTFTTKDLEARLVVAGVLEEKWIDGISETVTRFRRVKEDRERGRYI